MSLFSSRSALGSVQYSDHDSLRSLLKISDSSNPRLVRQLLYLNTFDFTVIYKPGAQNYVADMISRLPDYNISRTKGSLENSNDLLDPEKELEYIRKLIARAKPQEIYSSRAVYSIQGDLEPILDINLLKTDQQKDPFVSA